MYPPILDSAGGNAFVMGLCLILGAAASNEKGGNEPVTNSSSM